MLTAAMKSNSISTNFGRSRHFGPCYGVDTTGLNGVERTGPAEYRYCQNNYGVGTVLGRMRTSGDIANTNFMRRERVVYYKPNPGYLGIDTFR